MLFGLSQSDVPKLLKFCENVLMRCENIGSEYDEVSRKVRGLHTVLERLKNELSSPESPLHHERPLRERGLWTRLQFHEVVGDCDSLLHELDDLVSAIPSSVENPKPGNTIQLEGIKLKLNKYKSSLSLLLDKVQLQEGTETATISNTESGVLDSLLNHVDWISAKLSHQKGRHNSTSENNETEVWRYYRRELINIGFSFEVTQQYKEAIKACIRELNQGTHLKGSIKITSELLTTKDLLDEKQPSSTSTSKPSVQLFRMSPDMIGNEIPSDAKWTKVSRHLVLPVVLERDKRRYEARPEFVAILRVLSQEDIQEYMTQSHKVRERIIELRKQLLHPKRPLEFPLPDLKETSVDGNKPCLDHERTPKQNTIQIQQSDSNTHRTVQLTDDLHPLLQNLAILEPLLVQLSTKYGREVDTALENLNQYLKSGDDQGLLKDATSLLNLMEEAPDM